MASASYEETKKRRRLLFDSSATDILEDTLFDEKSNSAYIHSILHKDFENDFKKLPKHLESKLTESRTLLDRMKQEQLLTVNPNDSQQPLLLLGSTPETKATSTALSVYSGDGITSSSIPQATGEYAFADKLLVPRNTTKPKPQSKYHSNWKLQRVVLGHTGQVHSLAFDPLNKFFVTGSSDRTIKIWDLATSQLQLTLTGHIMAVRGLAISDRHPYMFSCSEDKTVKCWDLEKNRIVRDYHGHLSSVYTIDVHPTLDLIVTAGRDSAVRVWDIRTKLPVYTLTGHKSTINRIQCRATEPQIISCSMDSTVRTWDLVAGKCRNTLTYHSKSVRSFALNEVGDEFVSGSSDGLKKFKLPQCEYLQDMGVLTNDKMSEGNIIVNSISCNADNVMFVGCDNGQYGFWDWDNGEIFQQGINVPVPGSLSSESGILCSGFDHSGLRLVTGGVDKSIKVWKQVDE